VTRRRQNLAAALEPVLGEHPCSAATIGPSMRAIVSRHVGVPAMRLEPPVGDPGAAGERDAPVDDQQLAVRAVVEAMQPIPADRLIEIDLAAGLLQSAAAAAAHHGAADRVEHQRTSTPPSRAPRSPRPHVGDLTGLKM
jgi:hypothetical protein